MIGAVRTSLRVRDESDRVDVLMVGRVVERLVDGRADVRRETGILARVRRVADRAGHDREIHALAVEEHAAEHLARWRVGVVAEGRTNRRTSCPGRCRPTVRSGQPGHRCRLPGASNRAGSPRGCRSAGTCRTPAAGTSHPTAGRPDRPPAVWARGTRCCPTDPGSHRSSASCGRSTARRRSCPSQTSA